MTTPKLIELPTELQALVFGKLFDPPLTQSAGPSSDSSMTVLERKLPDDLLHVAQASPKLEKAVISSIGRQARYVSFRQTKEVWKWIPILKDHIKAVSLSGISSLGDLKYDFGQDLFNIIEIVKSNVMEDAAMKVLNALYSNEVKLEELHLENLELFDLQKAREMTAILTKAIRMSSVSLKKISLRANPGSAEAMRSMILPQLETVQIKFDRRSRNYVKHRSTAVSSSQRDLRHILKALHTNTIATSGSGTIRTLNLHLCHIPVISFKSCRRLFLGVRKLRLTFLCIASQRGAAKFIANFKNLETLYWSVRPGFVQAEDIDTIFSACRLLKDITLVPRKQCALCRGSGIAEDLYLSDTFFRSLRSQLQTANFQYLTREHINVLGQNSPNLKTFYLKINEENVGGLRSLLGNHCRQLCELRLKQKERRRNCLGAGGWSVLSDALRSAPPSFGRFSFIGNSELATEEMVEAVADILKSMGDSARTVKLQIRMRTTSLMVVLSGLLRILRSAVVNCKSIEVLCLDFVNGSQERFTIANSEKDDINRLYAAVCELRSVLSTYTNLKEVNLGNVDGVVNGTEERG